MKDNIERPTSMNLSKREQKITYKSYEEEKKNKEEKETAELPKATGLQTVRA